MPKSKQPLSSTAEALIADIHAEGASPEPSFEVARTVLARSAILVIDGTISVDDARAVNRAATELICMQKRMLADV